MSLFVLRFAHQEKLHEWLFFDAVHARQAALLVKRRWHVHVKVERKQRVKPL